jgi:NitT/TauT family transport system ATP-binding protein
MPVDRGRVGLERGQIGSSSSPTIHCAIYGRLDSKAHGLAPLSEPFGFGTATFMTTSEPIREHPDVIPGAISLPSGSAASPAAVSLADVTITFDLAGSAPYEAVQNASLQVRNGEFVAIVGPTGCGKSTLLNVAAGLLAPSSGRVEIFGTPLISLNRAAGYLFQADALFPWKTAAENIAIGLEIAGTSAADARACAEGWLARVGLRGLGARYPHSLSGGQRKRVGLAQVLIRNPRILLMDEPFGPLDAQTRLLMGDLLLKLWSNDRKAVLFVTHDLEEAIALSDRVVIMSAGPAARIIGDWEVALPRPRDSAAVKRKTVFQDLHQEIWAVLKGEVLKAYARTDGLRGSDVAS